VNKSKIPYLERLGQAPCPSLRLQHPKRKSHLVDLDRACLAREEWRMVLGITRLIQKRGWAHA
jgi:hypothetical protein